MLGVLGSIRGWEVKPLGKRGYFRRRADYMNELVDVSSGKVRD